MIRFSLFELKFPKPEVPPIIQNAVRSSGIRWICIVNSGFLSSRQIYIWGMQ